jgi:MarR family transcriptional regulator, temperature-dependent positive regulator of motility
LNSAITQEEVQILSVLDAIEVDHRASQRDLSRATGLNLAKVNYLLRRLADKGQLKLRNVSQNPNKLRYLYILTPGGLAEKSRLTMRFAARTWREYSESIERFRTRLIQLTVDGSCRVILLGANEVTDMVVEAGSDVEGLEFISIYEPSLKGESRRGIPVIDELKAIQFDRVIPCDDTEFSLPAVQVELGIPKGKIWLV